MKQKDRGCALGNRWATVKLWASVYHPLPASYGREGTLYRTRVIAAVLNTELLVSLEVYAMLNYAWRCVEHPSEGLAIGCSCCPRSRVTILILINVMLTFYFVRNICIW